MKIRLSEILNEHCLEQGAAVLAHFVDFESLATKLPLVAKAVVAEAKYRAKDVQWALETARGYLEKKFAEMGAANNESKLGEAVERLFNQVNYLTDRIRELQGRLEQSTQASAPGAAQ